MRYPSLVVEIEALRKRVKDLESDLEALQKAQEQRLQETPGYPVTCPVYHSAGPFKWADYELGGG